MLEGFVIASIQLLFRNNALLSFATYVLGAEIAFGPPDINPQKIFFFSSSLILCVFSYFEIKQKLQIADRVLLNQVKYFSGFFLSLLMFSLLVTLINQGSLQLWTRQVAPFVLIIIGVPIAYRCGISTGTSNILNLMAVSSLLTSISVFFYWGRNHHVLLLTSQPANKILLDALFCGIAYICAMIHVWRTPKHRPGITLFHFAVLFATISLLALSGTRTIILLFVFIFILSTFLQTNIVWFVKNVAIYGFSAFLAYQIAIGLGFINLSYLTSRYLNIGSSVKNYFYESSMQSVDSSLAIRNYQGNILKSIWKTDLLTGVGAIDLRGLSISVLSDNFYSSFAEFGVVGVGLIGFALLFLVTSFRRLFSQSGIKPASLIIYVATMFFSTFIINWPQDKGIWLGLMSLIALELSRIQYIGSET